MIAHVWSVLCNKVVTDDETGLASLIDLWEDVTVLGPLPEGDVVLPLEAVLVSYWIRSQETEGGRGQVELALQTPQGEMLRGGNPNPEGGFDIDLTTLSKLRTVLSCNALPFKGPGKYIFKIFLRMDGADEAQLVAEIPLWIAFAEQGQT